MSENATKKSKGRAQGWEEAGGEFYQERYVSDWEKMPNNTSVITTLLPSKQSRFGTTKHNTKGNRSKLRKTNYWQPTATTATAQTSGGTRRNELQFSVLPDLSQVLTDEERIWEEMLQIKLMPVSMQQKKSLKASLQSVTKLRLQGFQQFKWKHRKAWTKINLKWSELLAKLTLWQTSLKQIEGHFGTGVMAYFMLIRWLFFLNCASFALIFLFVILPNMLLQNSQLSDINCAENFNDNETNCVYATTTTIATAATTTTTTTAATETTLPTEIAPIINFERLLAVVESADIIRNSLMFYGAYSNHILAFPATDLTVANDTQSTTIARLYYDLPLAYVLVNVLCFALALIAIVGAAAREFNDRLINGKRHFYQYCNLLFGGWDFCIYAEKSAYIKHKALHNEIKYMLQSKQREYERHQRSKHYKYKLYLTRLLINLLVLLLLMLAAYIIYLLINISLQQQKQQFNLTDLSRLLQLQSIFIEYLPYITIVFLNLFLPTIFNYLAKFEKYTPLFELKVSVFRTMFIRFASLSLLLTRFYYIIIPQSDLTDSCWETFVAHQFYKLVITDFLCHILVTLLINYPRAMCARNCKQVRFIRFIGEQEFELPKHVLDIVYTQLICWLGCFYSPFLPACMAIMTFSMFYVKKFQCLVNSRPSKILYGTSRANSLFLLILLLSFVLAVIPITYALSDIRPSSSCGPFRGLPAVWDAAIAAFNTLPIFLRNCIFFFGTACFAVPAFFVLVLLLYYYYAVSDANKQMVKVLKNQLILEGHDKQFLLNRLSYFIKQHQDAQEQLNLAPEQLK